MAEENPYKSPLTEGSPAANRPGFLRFATRIGLTVAGVVCATVSLFWLASGFAGSLGLPSADTDSFLFAGINGTLCTLFFWLARMLRR
jgi:hypothetical protein